MGNVQPTARRARRNLEILLIHFLISEWMISLCPSGWDLRVQNTYDAAKVVCVNSKVDGVCLLAMTQGLKKTDCYEKVS